MLRWSWGPELFCGLGEELGLGVLSSLWPWGGPPQNRPLQVLVPLGGPHLPRTKLLCGCFVLALEPRQASDSQQSSRLCLRCWRERGSRIGRHPDSPRPVSGVSQTGASHPSLTLWWLQLPRPHSLIQAERRCFAQPSLACYPSAPKS